ncbi:MAG: Nif11-like leader peptide family natural product precursor [Oscillospiraceae bacterium]|nr:Nif11-like leader peptide family natural product precursor [Oscillospiraceae bacterium]
MNMEKIKEIFADEAFIKGLFELETAAEVQAALQAKGLELTEEDILGIREMLLKVADGEISVKQLEQWATQAERGELSEELLEQVSGGSVLGTIGLALIGAACVAAFAIATDDLIYECTGRHW